MVEKAFINIENYFEFFKDVEEIYKTKANTMKVSFHPYVIVCSFVNDKFRFRLLINAKFSL